jgi:DNA adenine methylase
MGRTQRPQVADDQLLTPLPKKSGPILKRHGGKTYLARRHIALMPRHTFIYAEHFVGGGSILMNRPSVALEYINDLDPELINFYTILAHPEAFPELAAELAKQRHTHATFHASKVKDPGDSPMQRAVKFATRMRMSRGGLGHAYSKSSRFRGIKTHGERMPEGECTWRSFLNNLPRFHERLRHVTITCGDGLERLGELDSRSTLHYCDPPYLQSTRTVPKAYDFEVVTRKATGKSRISGADEVWHERFLKHANACQGTVLIAGYPSKLYDKHLRGWTRHAWEMPNHSGQTAIKERRTEVLWIKPAT